MEVHKYTCDLVTRTFGNDVLEQWDAFLRQTIKPSPDGPWLCGGAVRDIVSGEITKSDWDVFFENEDQFRAFVSKLGEPTRKTDHCWTFKVGEGDKKSTVQAIRIAWFPNVAAVLDSFDFTICQFGWDGEKFFVGEYALLDLARKRLAVHQITYAVASVRRILKYARRGFTVCSGCIADILGRVAQNPQLISAEFQYID